MNRYTVVYLAEADENLIAIWADATDRDRVTEAADTADVFACGKFYRILRRN